MTPKNRIYNWLARFTWIMGLVFLFASCSNLDINFQVNGENANTGLESADQPSEPDTATMLKVYVGDTVVFRNTTQPASDVSSILWDIDGNGVIDRTFNDKNGFKTVYTKPGIIKTSLWINNNNIAVVKWIKVQGDFDLFTEIVPEIEFIEPTRTIEDTEERYFDVEAAVIELYASDSIVLLHNEKSIPFEFDENRGIITQRIELRRGENKIEVLAFPSGDELVYREAAIINYLTGSGGPMTLIVEQNNIAKEDPVIIESNPEDETDDVFALDEPDPVVIEPVKEEEKPVEINLRNTAKAGYEAQNIGGTCQSDLIESYTFTITPSVPIRLDDFLVFSDGCGGLQIKISSSKGTSLNTTETLTKGKSQISFGFITEEIYLDPNVKYTISLKAVVGNSNCNNPVTPKLLNTKACDPSLRKRPHLTTKLKGKAVVHDITYSY